MPNYRGLNGTTEKQKMWWVANHLNGGGDYTGNTPFPRLPDYMGGEVMLANDTTTSTVFSHDFMVRGATDRTAKYVSTLGFVVCRAV